jgi:hypothetical protein
MEDHHIAHIAKEVFELKLFGNGAKAQELSKIIKEHALMGTAAAFIPIPGADILALGGITWGCTSALTKQSVCRSATTS